VCALQVLQCRCGCIYHYITAGLAGLAGPGGGGTLPAANVNYRAAVEKINDNVYENC